MNTFKTLKKIKSRSKIKSLKAREILDSRGNPTVAVELTTEKGIFFASVPSGASKGKDEAMELRDGGKRYLGKGVLKAVANVNKIIAPKLRGKDPAQQKKIDDLMLKLDGTKNKSKLGANAILAVSMAVCRAGAAATKKDLWEHIAEISQNKKPFLPSPSVLMIEGGIHAGNKLDFQEFKIIPSATTFSEKLQKAVEIYHTLGKILAEKYGKGAANVGYEGGFVVPAIEKTNEILGLMMEGIAAAGYENTKIAIDAAASSFDVKGVYKFEDYAFTRDGLLGFYSDICAKYPIYSLEDPFSEDDYAGFKAITKELGDKVVIIGDDLLVTNIEKIKRATADKLCNGAIIKPNQIGTISETIAASQMAKKAGWKIIVSHRSGDTCDDFIADLAVGIGADFIKSGAPCRAERVAKYNRLLKIEEEIK